MMNFKPMLFIIKWKKLHLVYHSLNYDHLHLIVDSSCDVATASMCMYNFAASNMFPSFYPIGEREQTCR